MIKETINVIVAFILGLLVLAFLTVTSKFAPDVTFYIAVAFFVVCCIIMNRG